MHLKIELDDLEFTLDGDAEHYSFADSGFSGLLAYLYDFHQVTGGVADLSVKRAPKGNKPDDPTLLDCTVEVKARAGQGARKASVVAEAPDLPASFDAHERGRWQELIGQITILERQWGLTNLTVKAK